MTQANEVPATLVYGLWREETLAVVGAEWALQASGEIDEWERAATVADALRLCESGAALNPPVDPDAFDGMSPSERFDLADCGAVNDGDWPGMPAALTVEWLPDAEELGEWIWTIFNGPYLRLNPDVEERLVRLAIDRGHAITRDDRLINEIARWPC